MEIDIRMWSRELITDLINLYKSFPCLWKIKSESYKSKTLKEQSYQTLVQFCRSRGFTDANRDFVVKKIQSLRGSFRKELKKLEASRCGSASQKVYEPSLWYFDLLLFTKDQEHPADSVSTESDDSDSEAPSHEAEISLLVNNHQEQRNTESPEESRESGTVKHEKRRFETVVTQTPVQYKKKRFKPVQNDFLSTSRDSLKANRLLSEYEALGINVARKLERMDELQAIYAESLINSILRDGLLKKLRAQSDICNGTCRNESDTPSKGSRSTEMVTVYCITQDENSQEMRNGK